MSESIIVIAIKIVKITVNVGGENKFESRPQNEVLIV